MESFIKNLENRLKSIEDAVKKISLDSKEVFSTIEAAEFIGVSLKQMYKLMQERSIPFHKPSGKLAYFKKQDLLDYVYQNRINTKSELESEAAEFLTSKSLIR